VAGRPLRVAVIGVGSLGQHHARLLASMPEVDLVAVVDRDAARAAEIAARHGVAAVGDHNALGPEVEAVTVAVPTTAHARVVSDCLRRGLAVLVEKPMTPTVAEAEGLVDLAAQTGCLLAVGHTERFNPVVRAAAGRVREPRFIEAHRLGVFSARSTDVDVVLDLMIHDLDIVLNLVRQPILTLDAVGVHALTDKVDIANARLRFAGGCVANLTASRISTDKVRKLRVFEPNAYLSIDYARQEGLIYSLRRDVTPRPEIVREALPVEPEEPLLAELRAFVRRAQGEDVPVVTAGEGLAALRAACQILEQIGAQAGPPGPAT
jgi:predicted dehydrogenase